MSSIKEIIIEKWETKVNDIAKETGYTFEFLWNIWMDILGEDNPIHKTEETKWEYFRDVSYEFDW